MNRLLLAFVFFLLSASSVSAEQGGKVTYDDDVQPILRQHCFACHNLDDASSDLALDSFDGALAGGAGGEVLSAGDPEASRLWKLISHQEQPTMPPEDKLPDDKLAVIRRWIEGGLLKDGDSKPIKSTSASVVAATASAELGKPVGEPAMPAGLFHEPVVWSTRAGAVDVLATSPWAPLVAVAWQRQVSFYHTQNHQLLGVLPYFDGVPRVVRFSRDGSLVLIAGGRHAASGSASLFDVKTGAKLTTVGDELDIVLAADVSPDMSLVAIGGPKKKVRVYRTADGSLAYQLEKHTDWITALEFSPNGELLATADRGGGVRLWQAAAGHERGDLRGHTMAISSMSWRHDSALLATASEDASVRLWNSEGAAIKSISAHGGGALCVRFASDGRLVSAGRDRKVKTWKSDGAAIAEIATMPDIALAAEFTHDGAHLVASDYSGVVHLIDLANNQVVTALTPNPPTLARRLAALDSVIGEQHKTVDQGKGTVTAALASLESGRAAHAAHQQKLAAAQGALAAAEQRRGKDETTRATLEETFAHAQKAAVEAEATLAAAKEALAQSDETPTDEETAPETNEIAELLAQADIVHKAAAESVSKAKSAHDNALAAVAADDQNIQVATTALASVENETAGLPDIDQLVAAHKQTEVGLAAMTEQLAGAQAKRATVAAQQAAFASAIEKLLSGAQEATAQRDEFALQLAGQQAAHAKAAGVLSAHRNETASLKAELKELQARLQAVQTAEEEAAVAASGQQQQLTKLQQAHAAAQRRAQMVEARREAFVAAQKLRKSFSDSR